MTSCEVIITSYALYRVVALQMSPVNDTFLTGSLDKTVRLWDLKSPNCQVSEVTHRHGDAAHGIPVGHNASRWPTSGFI